MVQIWDCQNMNLKIMNMILLFLIKREYEGATLHINEPNNNDQINYLLGKNNEIIKNNISLNKLITKW